MKLSGTEPEASVVPVTEMAPAPVTVKVTVAPATGFDPTPSSTVAVITWVMSSVLVAVTVLRVREAGAAATQVMTAGTAVVETPAAALTVEGPTVVDVTLSAACPEASVREVTDLAPAPVTVKVTVVPAVAPWTVAVTTCVVPTVGLAVSG